MALNGGSLHRQKVARMGDYLAALTRHEGSHDAASAEIDLEQAAFARWCTDPHFTRALEAVRQLAHPGPPPLRITPHLVDITELLLDVAEGHQRVDRATVSRRWKQLATDLEQDPRAARFAAGGKGSWANQILGNHLRMMAKAGWVHLGGTPPQHYVEITDPAAMREMLTHSGNHRD